MDIDLKHNSEELMCSFLQKKGWTKSWIHIGGIADQDS